MKLSSTFQGVLLLMLGFVIVVYASRLPTITGQPYGPGLFPSLIGIAFAVCGLVNAISGVRSREWPHVSRTAWARQPGSLLAFAVTVGCIALYIMLSRWLGFIPISIVILVIMFRTLHVGWGKTLALSIIATFMTDYIFRTLLLVPLPFGILPRLPW